VPERRARLAPVTEARPRNGRHGKVRIGISNARPVQGCPHCCA
jgi:hypothetical protein